MPSQTVFASVKRTLMFGSTPIAPALPPSSARTVRLSPQELSAIKELGAARVVETEPLADAQPLVELDIEAAGVPRARAHRRLVAGAGVAAVLTLVAIIGVKAAWASNDRAWLAPTRLSSADPRVVQVAASLQQETARKNELLLQKTELEARLRETRRWIDLEESFQASFKAALRSDLGQARTELRRIRSLVAETEGDASATPTRSALEIRLAAVRERLRVLEAAADDERATRYDVLALRREYDRSVVAADKSRELADTLGKSLAETDKLLEQKEALLASIARSPYRLAIDGEVALGFLPYENADRLEPGRSLLSCRLGGLVCRTVGTVKSVLPGEVQSVHPTAAHGLRGQLVELALIDNRSAEQPMLYAGESVR